jgi:hypothetical protein
MVGAETTPFELTPGGYRRVYRTISSLGTF